jgi:beta-lactam-binding protein with PASTA domain
MQPVALELEAGTGGRDGAGRGPEDRGGGPWPWIVGLLILLIAGGAVAAYLLTRPAKATVPNVVYLKLATAQAIVQNDGFTPNVVYEPSTQPVDEVIGQSPLGGARVDAGATVTLTVSQGPPTTDVPPVTGLSKAGAEHAISLAGLEIAKIITQSSSSVQNGYAIDTDPPAGNQLRQGESVTLFISSGRAPVSVPGVTGYTAAAARSQLTGDGFKVSASKQPSTTVSAGNVISQSPLGGISAPYGSVVSIVIASAPTTAQVPSVTGFTSAAAKSTLQGAGFKVTTTTQQVNKQNQDGLVLSESPAGGTTQNKGSQVTIVVGKYVPGSTTTTTTPVLNPTTVTSPATSTPSTTTNTTPTSTSTSTSTSTTPTTTTPTTTTS